MWEYTKRLAAAVLPWIGAAAIVTGALLGVDKAISGYRYQRDAHRAALKIEQWLAAPAVTTDGRSVVNDGKAITHGDVLEAVSAQTLQQLVERMLAQQQSAAAPKK
jgi:hypothetical protein